MRSTSISQKAERIELDQTCTNTLIRKGWLDFGDNHITLQLFKKSANSLRNQIKDFDTSGNQRTIGPENAHLKPDLGVLSHHEMTLTLNTHKPLLTS